MITSLVLVAAAGLMADGVTTKFVDSGVTAKVGGYRPLQAKMDGTADLVKKAPGELAAPKYGTLALGDKKWVFILDEPEGKPATLYVDTNGDGDLTNDPATSWAARSSPDGLTMYQGKSQVDLGGGNVGSLGMYRFDPNDMRRKQLANTMMFYTDFGYELTLGLDGKEYTTFLSGKPSNGSDLWIDRNGDKNRSYKRETIVIGKPFNFTGTTYAIHSKDGELKLETSPEALPLTPLPPDLAIGKKVIPFSMAATDGTNVDFPKTYAGKLVMLDFWATWCGPCVAEIPNMKKAYEDWNKQGFEILGISFDQPDKAELVKKFTEERQMPWRQIYEGKGWETTLGETYDVSGIPFVLLVDGDTGEILATARELRGPGLSEFVGKALDKKTKANAAAAAQ